MLDQTNNFLFIAAMRSNLRTVIKSHIYSEMIGRLLQNSLGQGEGNGL